MLDRITAEGDLSPLDVRFADLLARLADRTQRDVITLTAALVSRERGKGHPCVELTAWAGRPLFDVLDTPRLPELAAWIQSLRTSTVVGAGSPPTPLVLDDAGRCYLHRYWQSERRVAGRIRQLTDAATDAEFDAPLVELFRKLFPAPQPMDADADRQAWVAAAILRNRCTIVSGGPGTGKTTTLARVLALLFAQHETLQVALAAPTGKAAARLSESVHTQARHLPVSGPVRDRIEALEARTLHRLLRYNPNAGGFVHDARRPLACDVLVIDEASMVDLLLMDAVLAAVPPHARIVLVGDKDQLASVEAGFVFGDCCDAAAQDPPSSEFAATFRSLAGRELPAPTAPAQAGLGDVGVELRLAWRFRDKPGIGALADAVRRADAASALRVLSDERMGEVRRHDLPADAAAVVGVVAETFRTAAEADSAEHALQALGRARILCATNHGPWSVESLNAQTERTLGLRSEAGGFYRGRPILVTQNDYTVGLFNGDVGICFPGADGHLRVWFATANGLRSVPTAKLPPHETAWAMTVHKSQGSEFETVVFVLPDLDGNTGLANRELVYTAVTRARADVTVFADAEPFARAVQRRAERSSGLRDLLVAR